MSFLRVTDSTAHRARTALQELAERFEELRAAATAQQQRGVFAAPPVAYQRAAPLTGRLIAADGDKSAALAAALEHAELVCAHLRRQLDAAAMEAAASRHSMAALQERAAAAESDAARERSLHGECACRAVLSTHL